MSKTKWVEDGKLTTSAKGLRKKEPVEIADVSRADTGKTSTTKTGRKVATTKKQYSKKTIAPRFCNSLPTITIDRERIPKLEKCLIV